MSRLYVVIAMGFLLGLRHATDSDHLVAMSTLVSRARRLGASWVLGALWGMGHTLTIFAVGTLIILLRVRVPSWAADGMEFSVGLMLAALGIMNLSGIRVGAWGISEHVHEHEHGRDGGDHHHHLGSGPAPGLHAHLHAHSAWLEDIVRAAGKFQLIRSFGVGMVHGLAGSTAVALLVLAAIPRPGAAMIYLVVFGLGSLVSMAALSASIEWVMFWTMHRAAVEKWLVSGTGAVSFCFGLYIMYKFGFA